MSSQPVPPTDGLHEELSAYLDGELDAESVRKVEERLARDAAYHAELGRLERAWGLLDGLPRASVDEKFTRSTIEMVAVEASQEAQAVLAEQPRRRRRQQLLGAAGMLAAGVLGFVIGTQIFKDPNEELLRDLSVIENFDRYYQADSIDFLQALAAAGAFAGGDEEITGTESHPVKSRTATPDDDDLRARRLEIAGMSPADRQELLRKQERFVALPDEEQDRLRQLQAAIDADPSSDRLRQVLASYHEWLKTLSTSERAELAEMPVNERVEKIMHERKREEAIRLYNEQNELLTPQDKRHIFDWLADIAWQQRDELLGDMSRDQRERFDRDDRDDQRRKLVYMALQRAPRDGRPGRFLDLDEQDIRRLADKLSPEAKQELAKRTSFQEQRKLVGGWIFATMFDRSRSGRGSRRSTSLLEADVARFFQQLEPRTRDQLMSLSPSKARDELRRMYWQRDGGETMFRGGPGGPRPDGKSFDRRRGPPRDGGPGPERTKRPREDDEVPSEPEF